MPHHKSAAKRLKKSKVENAYNRHYRTIETSGDEGHWQGWAVHVANVAPAWRFSARRCKATLRRGNGWDSVQES